MREDIVAGAVFPDYELTDHTGKRRELSELQGPDPMILVLSRGGYCPKDLRQAEGLVQLHHEMEVGYSRHESPRHRGGLAAGKCHRLVVAGSDRGGAPSGPESFKICRLRFRLW